MHVEKSYPVAFAERPAFDVEQFAPNLIQATNRNMSGNQRVRNAFEAALLQIDISAANLRELHIEQSRVRFELWSGKLAQLHRRVWCRDDSGKRHSGCRVSGAGYRLDLMVIPDIRS